MNKLIIRLKLLNSIKYWKVHIVNILSTFFAILGCIYLVIEIVNDFFPGTLTLDGVLFWNVLAITLVLSVGINLQKIEFDFVIKDKDIKIKLVIGDIFKQKGDIVIATNSTFDTTFKGDFISNKSIQGQLATKFYDKLDYLDSDIDKALEGYEVKEVLCRTKSKNNRYEIGTTIKLFHNNFKTYWVALADVNEYGKPSSNFHNVQVGLESLWNYLSLNGHMDRLVMPIIGSGRSAVNESREKILKEIIYSFVTYSNEKKLTEELVICIYYRDFIDKKIDLDMIAKFLEYNCEFRYENTSSYSDSIGI